MLFERRLREGLADGSITVAFRRWRRPQVVVGGRYRTGADGPLVKAIEVDVISPSALRASDARAAGYASVRALRADLRGDAGQPLYRITFRPLTGPDPRAVLAEDGALTAADRAALDARLARLDRAVGEGGGPWTAAVLDVIAARPGVLAGDLAADLRMERALFKRRVRALKESGLTISLPVGYRLSPRGEAYRSGA